MKPKQTRKSAAAYPLEMEGTPVEYLESRREQLYDWMEQEDISLAMFEDTEGSRDTAIRYLTGHPGDALLFLSATRHSMLVPWDINIANLYGNADTIIPYGQFDRRPVRALREAAEYYELPKMAYVEIAPTTSYLDFLAYVEELHDYDIRCRKDGIHEEVKKMRAIKDEEEIRLYRIVSGYTNLLIDRLEHEVAFGNLKTESDVALFIEAEGRAMGCEGTGFETLAAGPSRSFAIHAFPSYTGQPFGTQGLSVLDFGLKYQGYTSDVTATFVRVPLTQAQEQLLSLTQKAYHRAASLVKPGASIRTVALEVDRLFEKSRKKMPHALGHGIGLETHEAPFLRTREDEASSFQPGMIFTLEPGLYDPKHGGCRYENDFLVTDSGCEVLTSSRLIYL